MKRIAVYGVWAVYFGVALFCQLVAPNRFHIVFFAFPVNVALLSLVGVSLWILYKEKPHSRLAILLSAPITTFLLVAVSLLTFLVMGFTSWLTSASWWLFFVLTALSANLLFVIFRGFRKDRPYRLRFLFNHIGLFLALVCGFAGSADTRQWRLRVSGDEVTHEVFSPDGERARWRQGIKLEKFTVAYNLDGMPDSYEARLMVDDEEVSLRVNEPYALSLVDDLYLVDYEHVSEGETVGYCILEIVRQPWKYMQWVGICMMMLGSVLLFAQGVSLSERRKTP